MASSVGTFRPLAVVNTPSSGISEWGAGTGSAPSTTCWRWAYMHSPGPGSTHLTLRQAPGNLSQ
jgi:hypothetical protein